MNYDIPSIGRQRMKDGTTHLRIVFTGFRQIFMTTPCQDQNSRKKLKC